MAKTATATETAWRRALREAVEVERELRRLEDRKGMTLTADAFVREALIIASTTAEQAKAHRRTIEEGGVERFPNAWRVLSRSGAYSITKMILEGRLSQPAQNLNRLRWTDPDGLAAAEIVSVGGTGLFEVQAIAAMIVAEIAPNVFGVNKDWSAWEQRVAELRAKRDELFQIIGSTVPGDELEDVDARADGFARRRIAFTAHTAHVLGDRVREFYAARKRELDTQAETIYGAWGHGFTPEAARQELLLQDRELAENYNRAREGVFVATAHTDRAARVRATAEALVSWCLNNPEWERRS